MSQITKGQLRIIADMCESICAAHRQMHKQIADNPTGMTAMAADQQYNRQFATAIDRAFARLERNRR